MVCEASYSVSNESVPPEWSSAKPRGVSLDLQDVAQGCSPRLPLPPPSGDNDNDTLSKEAPNTNCHTRGPADLSGGATTPKNSQSALVISVNLHISEFGSLWTCMNTLCLPFGLHAFGIRTEIRTKVRDQLYLPKKPLLGR